MSQVSAIVFAYHGFGVEGLEALARLGVQVRRVFTHADHAGEQIWWRSVAEWAARQGVPCELDANLHEPEVRARIVAEAPDFIFSFYYRKMIPEAVLAFATRGAFNLHGSLLPKFRGRSPINWQLVMGELRSGLTLHRMVRQADAGDLIAQQAVAVHPDQDALGLTRQLLAIAPSFLERAIGDIIAERIKPQPQDHALATYFGGRTPAQGLIEWRRSARDIHNLVRAVAPPWPGAFTALLGRRLLVWRTVVVHERSRYGDPGTVLGDGTIACGTGSLSLLSMAWADDHAPVALVAGLRLISPPST